MSDAGLSGYGDAIPATASGSASARVFYELRARIISLKLRPATILNRAELAEAFGVSQSPIREALLRLEDIDLVITYRQSRTEVTRINPARLKQENFLRTGLECEVVDRLCRQGDAADLLKAKGYLKIQEALVDDLSQVELFRELDESFHRALFVAAGQEAIYALATEQSSQMARLRTLDLPRNRKLRAVLEGHQAVIARIEARDRHGAADAMREHLSGTIGRLPEIMADHRDHFAR
jgi:DNA-binding GntR family transcriptional regulator